MSFSSSIGWPKNCLVPARELYKASRETSGAVFDIAGIILNRSVATAVGGKTGGGIGGVAAVNGDALNGSSEDSGSIWTLVEEGRAV